MAKRYDQYCPIAHALELVGERWSLLVVRELLHGPQRYTDLAANLPGIGTNILASRLKDLEACGIVAKRRLPPPAASQVYELTAVRPALRPLMRELALWGAALARPAAAGRRVADGLARERARRRVLAGRAARPLRVPHLRRGRLDRRRRARSGSVDDPDVVVEGDVAADVRRVRRETAGTASRSRATASWSSGSSTPCAARSRTAPA